MPAQCPNIQRCPSEQGLWAPSSDFPNPALWLDAADLKTIRFGAGVKEWQDKSGNGRHFSQATEANQPKYDRNINGLGSVVYDGSNDTLSRVPEAWAYAYPITALVVFNASAFTNAYNGLLGFYTDTVGNTAGNSVFIKNNGKSAIYVTTTGAQQNYDDNGALTYAVNNTYVFDTVIKDNSLTSFGNAETDGTKSGTFTLRTNLGSMALDVGADPKFSRWTAWSICEVLIYNGAELSPVHLQKLRAYLAWKWGAISKFSAGKPYRFAPPRNNRILTRKRRAFLFMAAAAGTGSTTHNVTISESLTVADSQTATAIWSANLSASATVADAAGTAVTWAASLSQATSLSDVLTAAATWQASLSATTTLADIVTSGNIFSESISAAVTVAEAQAAAATYVGALAAAAGVSDTVAATAVMHTYITEATAIAAIQAAAAIYGLAVTEAITTGDTLTGGKLLIATLAETLGLADLLTAAQIGVYYAGSGRCFLDADVRTCVLTPDLLTCALDPAP